MWAFAQGSIRKEEKHVRKYMYQYAIKFKCLERPFYILKTNLFVRIDFFR